MNQQIETMNMTNRHLVQIGQPVNRTFHPALEIDAHALLWASAKGRTFIPAIATIGRKSYQNGPLRQEPLPDARKYPVLRERIGYWETALEIDDPEALLEAAVVSALNTFLDLLGDNPLAADPAKFVTTITQAAREWAEECFNTQEP
ncbi:MAG: hypothetical protein WEB53_05900 [Akkermansiaceae bacterium]